MGFNYAQADSIESLRQKMLFQVSKMEEFLFLKQQIFEIQKNETNCLDQWEHKILPISCYWLLKNKIDTDPSILPNLKITELDRLCSRSAKSTDNVMILNRTLKNLIISPNCREYYSQQFKKINYIKKMARELP